MPWSIVSILPWISDEMATKINLLNVNLKKLEKNIEKPVKALIKGNEKIVISSGRNFNENWENLIIHFFKSMCIFIRLKNVNLYC